MEGICNLILWLVWICSKNISCFLIIVVYIIVLDDVKWGIIFYWCGLYNLILYVIYVVIGWVFLKMYEIFMIYEEYLFERFVLINGFEVLVERWGKLG